MVKNLILSVLVVFAVMNGNAQAPNYDDLLVMYVDGEYEKLVKKAEKYTLNEKTKKDPIPWFYLSKGLYAISQSELADQEEYKKAYKDALKAMAKGIKYDKKAGGDLSDQFIDDIITMKKSLRLAIDDELTSDNLRKASGWAKYYNKISENPGAYLIQAAYATENKDRQLATDNYAKAKEMIDAYDGIGSLDDQDRWMLKTGLIEYANQFCASERTRAVAVDAFNIGKQWFEDDEDYMRAYNQCINGVNQVND